MTAAPIYPGNFEPVRVSSKFLICGLPLTGDSYRNCSFSCQYCFAKNPKLIQASVGMADVGWLVRKLKKVFDDKDINPTSFLDTLLADGITWHHGGLSDPFQPMERNYQITRRILEVTANYPVSILFSTKSDTPYFWDNLNPNRHAFHLSVTNVADRMDIEPYVPPVAARQAFFRELKDRGFRVGIRIQPFIPNVSGPDIVDAFPGADHYTIEGLKLIAANEDQREYMLNIAQERESSFTMLGLLTMHPEIRLRYYQPLIDKLEATGASYSIADNDLHHMGNNKCCCGDKLVTKATEFNNTTLFKTYGGKYGLADAEASLGKYANVNARSMIISCSQPDCKTPAEFLRARFKWESSPTSVKFAHSVGQKQLRLEDME